MFREIYNELVKQAESVDVQSVDYAFVVWMNERTVENLNKGLPSDFVVTNYLHVASIGFLLEENSVGGIYDEWLCDGLNRVSGRPITQFETEPAQFRHDAIALLGLALGARRVKGDVQRKVVQWMNTFIVPSDKTVTPWKRVFSFATLAVVGSKIDYRDIVDLSECNDLKVAFLSKRINCFDMVDVGLAYKEISHNTMVNDVDPIMAACRLSALIYLNRESPTISVNRPKPEEIVNMLDRLSAGLKRWPWEDHPKTRTSSTQKWDIQNEYHVQSLAYAILAPIFPDIEDEFYFESVGQLNPRADIGLPSISTIVEIKFLRSGISFSKIIEEVAADASLYFKRSSVYEKKYSQMIVLLWDNSSRTQHHHEFKKGVSQLVNIVGSVVVSRPGTMVVKTSTSDTKIKSLEERSKKNKKSKS